MATLQSQQTDGVTVIHLSGSLTCDGVDQIRQQFVDAAQGDAKVVVDLSGVDLVATPGIAMLLNADRALKRSGGRLILAGARPFVRDLLHQCRLDTLWTLVPDAADAVRQAQAPAK